MEMLAPVSRMPQLRAMRLHTRLVESLRQPTFSIRSPDELATSPPMLLYHSRFKDKGGLTCSYPSYGCSGASGFMPSVGWDNVVARRLRRTRAL